MKNIYNDFFVTSLQKNYKNPFISAVPPFKSFLPYLSDNVDGGLMNNISIFPFCGAKPLSINSSVVGFILCFCFEKSFIFIFKISFINYCKKSIDIYYHRIHLFIKLILYFLSNFCAAKI